MKTRIWNLRFRLGWSILPGVHKHVRVEQRHADCDRADCR